MADDKDKNNKINEMVRKNLAFINSANEIIDRNNALLEEIRQAKLNEIIDIYYLVKELERHGGTPEKKVLDLFEEYHIEEVIKEREEKAKREKEEKSAKPQNEENDASLNKKTVIRYPIDG